MIKEEKEIKINRGWLEDLVMLAALVGKPQGSLREVRIASLLGYISSAKFILKINK